MKKKLCMLSGMSFIILLLQTLSNMCVEASKCNDKYKTERVGTSVHDQGYACCAFDTEFLMFSQSGEVPIISHFTSVALKKSLKVDFSNRAAGETLKAVQGTYWADSSTEPKFIISLVWKKTNGYEHPCIMRYNIDDTISWMNCIEREILGLYDPSSNRNVMATQYYGPGIANDIGLTARRANGYVFTCEFDTSSGTHLRSYYLTDPSTNARIKGDIIGSIINYWGNRVILLDVENSDAPTYYGNYVLFNMRQGLMQSTYKIKKDPADTAATKYVPLGMYYFRNNHDMPMAREDSSGKRNFFFCTLFISDSITFAYVSSYNEIEIVGTRISQSSVSNLYEVFVFDTTGGKQGMIQMYFNSYDGMRIHHYIIFNNLAISTKLIFYQYSSPYNSWMFYEEGTQFKKAGYNFWEIGKSCIGEEGTTAGYYGDLVIYSSASQITTNPNIISLTSFIDSSAGVRSLTTTVSGQTDFKEEFCGAIGSNGTNPMTSQAYLKNQTYTSKIDVHDLFGQNYRLQCVGNDTIYLALEDYTVNTTVLLPNDTIPTWVSVDANGNMTITDIDVSFPEVNFSLTVNAYSDFFGSLNSTVQITLNNYLPYSTTMFTEKTYVAGAASETFDLATYILDYEDNPLTNFAFAESGGNSLDCLSLSGTQLTIDPDMNDADCDAAVIVITATDSKGNSSTFEFNLAVTNNPPQVSSPLTPLVVYDNISFTHSFDCSGYFTDADPTHTLSYTLHDLPAFVTTATVTGSTAAFAGNASVSDVGDHIIRIIATDGFDNATLNFNLSVVENKPPTAPSAVTIQANEGVAAFTVIDAFTDFENNPVFYNCTIVSSLNDCGTLGWLIFDSSTRNISYTPTSSSLALNQLVIYGWDAFNTPVSVSITVNVNFKPKVNPAVTGLYGKFVAQQLSNFTVAGNLFTDEAPLTLNVTTKLSNGSATPAWVIMTPPALIGTGFFNFSGIYPDFNNVYYYITLTAKDEHSLTASVDVAIEIEATCHSTCNECTGPAIDDCSSCYDGRFLYLTVCKQVCPSGTFENSDTNTCDACDDSCQSCTGPNNSDCTKCFSNSTISYFEFDGECMFPCPDGYYANSTSLTCLPCHSYCTKCYGPSTTQCTECDIENRYVLVDPDTCQYLECPSLTYYDETEYACKDCHDSCRNCYGGSDNNCIDCPYSTFLTSDHHCKTCIKIDSGLKFQPLANQCVEQCGKGFNLGFLECDDGNLLNEDGCNQSCKVETDWKCGNGTSTTPDVCFSLIGPDCEISSISSVTHQVSIACSEEVVFNSVSSGDLTISIEGPLSPYSFKYIIGEPTGFKTGETGERFRIQMEFLSSLYGNYEEKLVIVVNTREILEDLDGNYLQTEKMSIEIPFKLVVLSEEDEAQASSQSSFSIISLILTFGTSMFIQVVLGGTIEATWLLLGTLQLMSLLPLLNLNLPANFRQFSKNLAMLHGEPTFLPNLFDHYYDTLDVEKEPYNDYFELMGFNTQFLLLNAGRKIEIWILIFMVSCISWLLIDLFGYAPKIGKIITKVDTKLRYGIIIRAVSQSYVSMVLSTALNVMTISWSGEDVSFMSNLIALVAAIVMIYIPLIAFAIIHKAPNLEDINFQKRYKTFIVDLKTTSPLCFQFICVFFFRRAVYSCAFVLISETPKIQIGYLIISVVLMTTYIVIIMPYKSPLSRILSIMNELLLLSMMTICVRFVNPQINPNLSKTIGLILIVVLIATIALNWIGIIAYGLIISISKYRAKKALKLRTERLKEVKKFIEKSAPTEPCRLEKRTSSTRILHKRQS